MFQTINKRGKQRKSPAGKQARAVSCAPHGPAAAGTTTSWLTCTHSPSSQAGPTRPSIPSTGPIPLASFRVILWMDGQGALGGIAVTGIP